jgi:hypothetical protein
MSFDYNRIRRGELIAGISAIALIILMFLNWYSFSVDNRTLFLLHLGHRPVPLVGTAWHTYSNTSLLLVLLVVVALALPVVSATQQKINFPLAAAATGLAVVVAIVIIYKLFIHRPGGNNYGEVAVGGYLGLLAILGIVAGTFMTALEDGWTWGDADSQSPAEEADEPRRDDVTAPGGETS